MKFGNLLFVALFVFTFTATTYAQGDFETVATTFNEVAAEENLDNKIKGFEEILPQAQALDEEGAEIVEKITGTLPKLYYKKAATYYKAKDFANAITAFEMTEKKATEFGAKDLAKKSKGIVPKLCYAHGAKEAKAKNYESAITYLKKAVTLKPKYGKAHYTLGSTYKKMKKAVEAQEAFSAAIEHGDEATQEKAKKALGSLLIASGKSKSASKDFGGAIADLTKAQEYLVGNEDKMAQTNFELGNVYKKQGDNGKACAAYKKAMHGPYLESAKYQVEVELKCN